MLFSKYQIFYLNTREIKIIFRIPEMRDECYDECLVRGKNMDWMQFAIFLITSMGMFFWNRSESRSDIRHMDTKFEEHRREVNSLLKAIHDEMSDFHARLCSIEERYRERSSK